MFKKFLLQKCLRQVFCEEQLNKEGGTNVESLLWTLKVEWIRWKRVIDFEVEKTVPCCFPDLATSDEN
jgi:hypothetical protein